MTNINSAGYMIQDRQGNAIYGVGDTVDAAWAMVLDDARNDMGGEPWVDADDQPRDPEYVYMTYYKTYGASAALIKSVMVDGGDLSWEIVGGVACLPSEIE